MVRQRRLADDVVKVSGQLLMMRIVSEYEPKNTNPPSEIQMTRGTTPANSLQRATQSVMFTVH